MLVCRTVVRMMQGKADDTPDKSPSHDMDCVGVTGGAGSDCVTGGAASDEFSPTASPGSPLDSDEALEAELPAELLVDKSCTSDKDDLSVVTDRSHTKDLTGKVSQMYHTFTGASVRKWWVLPGLWKCRLPVEKCPCINLVEASSQE